MVKETIDLAVKMETNHEALFLHLYFKPNAEEMEVGRFILSFLSRVYSQNGLLTMEMIPVGN